MPPSRRDKHASAWQRRNEQARALGYRNYYDYRVHGYGDQPPGPIRISEAVRAERRGHSEEAFRAFVRNLEPGDEVMLADHIRFVEKQGTRYGPIEFQVIPEDPERDVEIVKMPPMTRAALADLVAELDAQGAVLTPVPSLDVRRLYR